MRNETNSTILLLCIFFPRFMIFPLPPVLDLLSFNKLSPYLLRAMIGYACLSSIDPEILFFIINCYARQIFYSRAVFSSPFNILSKLLIYYFYSTIVHFYETKKKLNILQNTPYNVHHVHVHYWFISKSELGIYLQFSTVYILAQEINEWVFSVNYGSGGQTS